MIEYIDNYLEQFHYHKNVFSEFRTIKSTKSEMQTLKKKITYDTQEERESDSTWNNRSATA
jgi:hypothetical protein